MKMKMKMKVVMMMMIKIKNSSLLFFVLLLISGCGNNSNNDASENNTSLAVADYELLFMGNSHSSANGLPNLVAILIQKGYPNKTVNAIIAPGSKFLDERLADNVSQQSLNSRAWTHVILQAQKYSSTGLYSYPTDAAEEWIRRIRQQNANPILFPEWPRRGNTEEGLRVHELHLYITSQEPACVAPIGLAWDESIARYPNLDLHAPDGNHSNLKGALLAAYVFYQAITGLPAEELGEIDEINVDANIQKQLREIASFVINNNLSCE